MNLDCEVAEERKLFICGGNVGIHQTNTLFSSVHEVEQLCLLPCGNQLGSFYACYRVWILSSSLIFLYCFLFSCSSHCLVLHKNIPIGIFHHHHHQSLNREDRWGTTDDFATSFLNFPLFTTALWDLPNSRPVHSLMLYSHLFLCLPCLLLPFTMPCKMVLARPDERVT